METDDKDASPKAVRDLARRVLEGVASGTTSGAPTGPEAVLVGATVGGIGGLTLGLLDLAAAHFASFGADKRLIEADARLQAEALEEHREPLEKNLNELREKVGPREAESTVTPNLQAWARAWKTADGKKQRVIMAALVSAFDPASHEQAMSLRFFALLEHLDYPELHWLTTIYRQLPRDDFSALYVEDEWHDAGKETYMLRGLSRLGLLRSPSPHTYGATWLGQGFVDFLARGGFGTEVPDAPNTAERSRR